MKKLKFLAAMAILFIGSSALAQGLDKDMGALICETSRQTHVLKISEGQVNFMLPIYQAGKMTKRFPASSSSFISKDRSKNAYEIITYFETKRFKILINLENDDYSGSQVTIRSRDGHEMTCPLTCRLANDQI